MNDEASSARPGARGRVVPPVAAMLCVAVPMWLVARLAPALAVDLPGRRAASLVLALTGAAVALAGVAEFRRARTTVNPLRPERASALVVSGIFRRTRNPMYLGLAFVLLGWAWYLQHALAVLGVPAFVAWMNRSQIPREEHALERLFGAEFAHYKTRVRRWL